MLKYFILKISQSKFGTLSIVMVLALLILDLLDADNEDMLYSLFRTEILYKYVLLKLIQSFGSEMASDQVMILLVISLKNIVDLSVQCVLLLSFVFARIMLGIMAMGVELLDSSVVEHYR